MARAYYNEIDPAAVHVLRALIAEGVLPPGDVDDRSIKDVKLREIMGYTQHHFFAGGGIWPLAARIAGWPDDKPLWTGSCPCQGESLAGKRLGPADPRDLWPNFRGLISGARPPVVMGEQVAAAISSHWLDRASLDMEIDNYAFRAVDLPACAVDAPHQRNRIYWLAVDGFQPDADGRGCGRREEGEERGTLFGAAPERASGELRGSFWRDAEWIISPIDGKARRSKPGIRFLVDGLPGRVDLWRIGGNAIVAPLAAEVIAAALDIGL